MKRIAIILLALLMLCTIAQAAELYYQSCFRDFVYHVEEE